MIDAGIRDAAPDDAAAIAAIYAHHVVHGTATFDTAAPTPGDWAARIAGLRERDWPILVARVGRGIAGYAYAAQFRDRPGYAGTCEDSIYVAADMIGRGVGTRLLGQLVRRAGLRGFRQMIAVIGGPEPASVALHAGNGFVEAGRLRAVGWKHGRLLDTLYMQRDLRTGPRPRARPSPDRDAAPPPRAPGIA